MIWAAQMKSAGLVTGKTSVVFYSWTIETGPLMQSDEEIWEEIAALLSAGKVGCRGGRITAPSGIRDEPARGPVGCSAAV
jgi:hypothetical protein